MTWPSWKQALDAEASEILAWAKARRGKMGAFGRFRFAKSSPRCSLSASLIALLDVYDYFDELGCLAEKQKAQWARHLQSHQERKSGLFIDKRNRKGIRGLNWSTVAEYDTARSLDALRLLGCDPPYPLRGTDGVLLRRLTSPDVLAAWLENQDWDRSPWGAATAVQQIAGILREVRPENYETMMGIVKDFIYSTQDASTGLWGKEGCDRAQALSAAYKMIIILGELGFPIPNRDRMFEAAQQHFLGTDPAHMCFFRNNLCVIVETLVDRSGVPRPMTGPRAFRAGILEAVSRLTHRPGNSLMIEIIGVALKQLRRFKAADGAYSFHPGFATSHHNGVILCKGRRLEGDFLGASNATFVLACMSALISMLAPSSGRNLGGPS